MPTSLETPKEKEEEEEVGRPPFRSPCQRPLRPLKKKKRKKSGNPHHRPLPPGGGGGGGGRGAAAPPPGEAEAFRRAHAGLFRAVLAGWDLLIEAAPPPEDEAKSGGGGGGQEPRAAAAAVALVPPLLVWLGRREAAVPRAEALALLNQIKQSLDKLGYKLDETMSTSVHISLLDYQPLDLFQTDSSGASVQLVEEAEKDFKQHAPIPEMGTLPPRRSDKFEWPSRTSQQNETNQTGASSTKKDSFAFKMRSKQAKAFYGEKSRKQTRFNRGAMAGIRKLLKDDIDADERSATMKNGFDDDDNHALVDGEKNALSAIRSMLADGGAKCQLQQLGDTEATSSVDPIAAVQLAPKPTSITELINAALARRTAAREGGEGPGGGGGGGAPAAAAAGARPALLLTAARGAQQVLEHFHTIDIREGLSQTPERLSSFHSELLSWSLEDLDPGKKALLPDVPATFQGPTNYTHVWKALFFEEMKGTLFAGLENAQRLGSQEKRSIILNLRMVSLQKQKMTKCLLARFFFGGSEEWAGMGTPPKIGHDPRILAHNDIYALFERPTAEGSGSGGSHSVRLLSESGKGRPWWRCENPMELACQPHCFAILDKDAVQKSNHGVALKILNPEYQKNPSLSEEWAEQGAEWVAIKLDSLTTANREYVSILSICEMPLFLHILQGTSEPKVLSGEGTSFFPNTVDRGTFDYAFKQLMNHSMKCQQRETTKKNDFQEMLLALHLLGEMRLTNDQLSKIAPHIHKLRSHWSVKVAQSCSAALKFWKICAASGPSAPALKQGEEDHGAVSLNSFPDCPTTVGLRLWAKLCKKYNAPQLRAIAAVLNAGVREHEGAKPGKGKNERKPRATFDTGEPGMSAPSSGQNFTIRPSITLLQGPPGTGKTRTVIGVVSALLAEKAGFLDKEKENVFLSSATRKAKSVLICAPSNGAVDELVSRLVTGKITNEKGKPAAPLLIRLGTCGPDAPPAAQRACLDAQVEEKLKEHPQSLQLLRALRQMERAQQELKDMEIQKGDPNQIRALSSELKQHRKHYRECMDALEKIKKSMRMALIEKAEIVCATLSQCGGNQIIDSLSKTGHRFRTVVVDEAGQAVEPSCLIPLRLGAERLVLVGDPRQLPATVISTAAQRRGYDRSLFERLERAGHPVHVLTVQYRMHPAVRAFPSKRFYNGQLADAPALASLGPLGIPSDWPSFHRHRCFAPFLFYDLTGSQEERIGTSVQNSAEALFVCQILNKLLAASGDPELLSKVGVITPYKSQVRRIRREARARLPPAAARALEVNSVDGFQGREKQIIIFSCVRSHNQGQRSGVGFLSDKRRMNVALTRAQRSLLVVGNSFTLQLDENWEAFVESARQRTCYINVQGDSFEKVFQYYSQRQTRQDSHLKDDDKTKGEEEGSGEEEEEGELPEEEEGAAAAGPAPASPPRYEAPPRRPPRPGGGQRDAGGQREGEGPQRRRREEGRRRRSPSPAPRAALRNHDNTCNGDDWKQKRDQQRSNSPPGSMTLKPGKVKENSSALPMPSFLTSPDDVSIAMVETVDNVTGNLVGQLNPVPAMEADQFCRKCRKKGHSSKACGGVKKPTSKVMMDDKKGLLDQLSDTSGASAPAQKRASLHVEAKSRHRSPLPINTSNVANSPEGNTELGDLAKELNALRSAAVPRDIKLKRKAPAPSGKDENATSLASSSLKSSGQHGGSNRTLGDTVASRTGGGLLASILGGIQGRQPEHTLQKTTKNKVPTAAQSRNSRHSELNWQGHRPENSCSYKIPKVRKREGILPNERNMIDGQHPLLPDEKIPSQKKRVDDVGQSRRPRHVPSYNERKIANRTTGSLCSYGQERSQDQINPKGGSLGTAKQYYQELSNRDSVQDHRANKRRRIPDYQQRTADREASHRNQTKTECAKISLKSEQRRMVHYSSSIKNESMVRNVAVNPSCSGDMDDHKSSGFESRFMDNVEERNQNDNGLLHRNRIGKQKEHSFSRSKKSDARKKTKNEDRLRAIQNDTSR